jgi:ABC-2 type transport system permease protein
MKLTQRLAYGWSWRLATLKNGWADAIAYRMEYLFEVLGSAFVPVAVQLLLWYAVFKVGGASELAGMGFIDLVNYTIMSSLFSQVRGGNHDFELNEMIRNGGLSNYLLKPVGIIEFVYLRGVAPKLMIAGICIALGFMIAPFVGSNPLRMFGAMLLALMGNIIHYQIGAALAAAAFYWEEAYSILMVKNLVVSLLSGELLPLTLFPEQWSWVWKATPFYLYVYGPTQYALGKWTHLQLLEQLGISLLWMVAAATAVNLTWRISIKRYLSLGG